ncbi:MAG: efflux RND transporter periplasmic adaptor subunit [bacterium]
MNMQKITPILFGLLFLIVGFSAVVIADRMEWIPGRNGDSASATCEHELATGECPFCDPSLIEKLGQCGEHGVPEAFCYICNPDLVAAFKIENDWCGEHKRPESQCTICDSSLLEIPNEIIYASLDDNKDIKLVEATDLRSKTLPSVTCKTETLRVQLSTPEIVKASGMEFEKVRAYKLTNTINSNVEIDYDNNKLVSLSSLASGTVRGVYKDLGDFVNAGEMLAGIDSSDLGTAKSEYLQACLMEELSLKNYNREQMLLENQVATEPDVLQAETDYTQSLIAVSRTKQRLRNFGFSDSKIQSIKDSHDSSSILPLSAPFSGYVINRSVVKGEVVEPGQELFSIADLTNMWAILDIYEQDIALIEIDQPVMVEVDALSDQKFAGSITWISSSIDTRTRTLKVRAELENPDKLLRAGMFGQAKINTESGKQRLVVP